MSADPFESPKLLLEGTGEDLKELYTLEDGFLNDPQMKKIVQEFDPKSRCQIIKMKILKEPPPAFRRRAAQIVNDLRHALDQALFAAAQMVLGSKPKDVYFPFASTPTDFQRRLEARHKDGVLKIPSALHSTIKLFEPYPTGNGYKGGNDLLRTLGTVSGPNKHQLTLRTGVFVDQMRVDGVWGHGFSILEPIYNSRKNEVPLFSLNHPGAEVYYNINMPLYVAFRDAKTATDIHVRELLADWGNEVTWVVAELEAAAAAIVAGRL